MKHTLTVFFTIIFMVTLCTNTYAAEFVERGEEYMDTKVAETIESQLSRTEKEFINNIDNTLSNELLLKVYNEISWFSAGKSPSEMIADAEKFTETTMYKDYYVLSDAPYRVKIGQGQVLKDEGTDIPQYVQDIIALADQVEINGNLSAVTGIYCFDGNNSHNGIIVYILTPDEALIKYYDHPYAEALLLSEGNFKEYANDYYDYITSYENNYNEFGEPIGGGMLSFKDFIGSELVHGDAGKVDIDKTPINDSINSNDIKQTKSTSFFSKYGTILLGIIFGTLLLTVLSVIGYKFYNRRTTR